jgi:hypothetical protein
MTVPDAEPWFSLKDVPFPAIGAATLKAKTGMWNRFSAGTCVHPICFAQPHARQAQSPRQVPSL